MERFVLSKVGLNRRGFKLSLHTLSRKFTVMNKVNVALVRLLQFVVFVIFTFMVLAYFGAMILVPLDLVVLLLKIFGLVGLGGIIGAAISVAIVAYLGMIVYKTPDLIKTIVETGLGIVSTGKERVEAFNKIAENIK